MQVQAALADHGLWFSNGRVAIALSQNDNAAGISVLEHRMPFGEAPPLHIHHGEDEIFIVLEGEMTFSVGGREIVVRAGDTVCAPGGVPHAFRVTAARGARAYTVTRGGFERLVRAMSRPADHAGLPDFAAPGPEEQRRLAEACAAANIEIVGPPLA